MALRPFRLLVTGGGTGGHIYPAIAIARRALERHGPGEVLYVGTEDGLEAEIVHAEGLPFTAIASRGLVGKGVMEKALAMMAVVKGLTQAVSVLRRFRPDVVVGTGGYVSAPVVLAASLMRIPTVIQEQNALPGLTNRWLSRFATRVAIPHPASAAWFPQRGKLWVTGNPVRPEVLRVTPERARQRLQLPSGRLVLIFFGSRGSGTAGKAVLEAVPLMAKDDGVTWLFVTGAAHYEQLNRQVAEACRPGNLVLKPYLREMPEAMALAEVVVARAGAITLAEVTALGKPSVLVPSPYVAHNHQEANARLLEQAGAALVLPERELTGAALHATVTALLADADRLERMRRASRSLARPEALDELVDGIVHLARGEEYR